MWAKDKSEGKTQAFVAFSLDQATLLSLSTDLLQNEPFSWLAR